MQTADDRLADAQSVRHEQVALTVRVVQLDATAQDHRVALALLEQIRQSLAKDHAMLTQTHERLVQSSAERIEGRRR